MQPSRLFRLATLGEHVALAIATAAYVSLLFVYLVVAAFNDHIEVSVGAIASALQHGQPLYHGATGAVSYELPYGPNVFLVLAGALALLGPSIFALKLPCFLACMASGTLVFAVLRRRVSLRCASGAWLVFLVYLAYYDESAYWCRPEPFLLFGSALGLWLVRKRRFERAYLEVLAHAGVVAWMIGLKATGVLYVIPILVLLARVRGARTTGLSAAVGVVGSFAVFALTPLSFPAYAAVLEKTARHGFAVRDFLLGASAAFFLLCPIAIARATQRKGVPAAPARPRWPVPYRTLVCSVIATCVIAAKPGAGCHHILPFLPLGIDALVDAVDGAERERVTQVVARVATSAGRVTFALIVALSSLANVYLIARKDAGARSRASEVRAVLAAHSGSEIQMGYSTDALYDETFERIFIAFEQPLYLDAGSQMDSTGAGYDATKMFGGSLASCHPKIWLLPHGDPFSLKSRYRARTPDQQTVFDARFRADFAARYVKVESTTTYDVYECRASIPDFR